MSPASKREILICGVQFDHELRSGAMSQLDLAPIAKRLGAQGIEYREIYWKDKSSELPAVRQQLDRLGLKATYATFTTLFNRDPARREQLMQDLEDAHALGSPLMRVFQGERPNDGPEDAAMRDGARAVIDRAATYGMRLALENYARTPGGTLAEIQDTLQRLDSPVMGTNIDTANYLNHGQDPLEAIRALSPWIIYCHLKDSRRTPDGPKSTYIGNGILPIRDILAAFDATGRNIPLCFEFHGETNAEAEIATSMVYIASL